jgi:hypothetical protein
MQQDEGTGFISGLAADKVVKKSWREEQQKMVHVLPGGRVQESSGEIRG